MSDGYDVVVVGLGSMGSAAAWRLAERGLEVLGLDRFTPPHDRGSSHGGSRVIREAFFEDPLYVPLAQRAYLGWDRLQQLVGGSLLQRTGGLLVGPEEGELIRGTLESLHAHEISHRVFSMAEMRRDFPGLEPAEGMVGVLEERAGVLATEQCVEAALTAARKHGAELRFDTALVDWGARGEGVAVRTTRGEHRAGALVLALGPWLARLPGFEPPLPLAVSRQVVHWFTPAKGPERFGADPHPVTVWEYAPGRIFYTVPDLGEGVKVAIHYEGEATNPDQVDRRVRPAEVARARSLLNRYLPDTDGPLRDSSVCLYTNAPDRHFVLGFHPEAARVVVAGAGSGHAFKFAPALGELVADLVADGETAMDLTPFSPRRFAS